MDNVRKEKINFFIEWKRQITSDDGRGKKIEDS